MFDTSIRSPLSCPWGVICQQAATGAHATIRGAGIPRPGPGLPFPALSLVLSPPGSLPRFQPLEARREWSEAVHRQGRARTHWACSF